MILEPGVATDVNIQSTTVRAGSGSPTEATFVVTLSAAPAQELKVDYTTADGTAKAGTDYIAASGTLDFQPGQTARTITVMLVVLTLPG